MSDNETFVYPPSTPPSTDNTNNQFEEIRDLLRSAAFSINSFGERLGFMELRLAAVEAIRSNKTSNPVHQEDHLRQKLQRKKIKKMI
jgi:hypothetical protein